MNGTVAALSGFMINASAFGALLVFARDWALGYHMVSGPALEAALPLLTPRFIGQDWHFYQSVWVSGIHGDVVGGVGGACGWFEKG